MGGGVYVGGVRLGAGRGGRWGLPERVVVE